MFGRGFIHFTQPTYVQKSAEIYLANLTNLALMPNFPFVSCPQTNVASMEFKFLCSIIPLLRYSCKLTHLSHLLHLVPTMVICDWPETHWRLDVVRRPTKMRPRSTQSMRSTTGALWALGFGLFMALGIAISDMKTQHCHERHRPSLHSGFKHVSCMFLTPPFFGMHRGG